MQVEELKEEIWHGNTNPGKHKGIYCSGHSGNVFDNLRSETRMKRREGLATSLKKLQFKNLL